jgi:hypothetical protein
MILNRLVPDTSGASPGYRDPVDKWVNSTLEFSSKTAEKSGIVMPSEEMAKELSSRSETALGKYDPRMPGRGPGLVVIGNRYTAQDATGQTFAPSRQTIINTFFHELGLHAGRISAGKDAAEGNRTVAAWKKQIDKMIPDAPEQAPNNLIPSTKPSTTKP